MHLASGASPTGAAKSSEKGRGDVVLSWSKITVVGSKGEPPYELKQTSIHIFACGGRVASPEPEAEVEVEEQQEEQEEPQAQDAMDVDEDGEEEEVK